MTERHEEALDELRSLLREVQFAAQQTGYGYFHGGDPTVFTPDEESCTPEEIEAHRVACERWKAGDKTPQPGPHEPLVDGDGKAIGHITIAHFGVGTYSYEDETMMDWADRLDRCIARLERSE